MEVDGVLVWGAGAMGGTIGAHLVRAGHPVHFVDTAAEHVESMRRAGLRITGPVDELTVEAPSATPDELGADDTWQTILLCVKAHHTAEASRMLEPHLAGDGAVVSVQNGLNEEVIAEVVGVDRVVGCFVNFGADYLEPGVIHHGGRGTVVVGELDGHTTPRIETLHALLQDFEPRTRLSDNVRGYLWSKLAYASMLFATAVTDDAIADVLNDAALRPVITALAREVVGTARAVGIVLESFDGFDPAAYASDAAPDAAAASLDALVAFNRRSAKTHSGIWRDLAVRHRKTEVDAQLGAVAAKARELGADTPLNERLITMIHQIEDGDRRRDRSTLLELAELIEEPS